MAGGAPPQDPMAGGAPAGGMPGGQQQMPPDMASMYGAIPPEQGQGGAPQGGGGQMDTLEMLHQAAGG